MCNDAASLSENIYLLSCGFLKLLYWSFKVFQSKLDIDTIVFCLKYDEDNSVIFLVGILATWKLTLKLPPPWSQPSLIWISFLMNVRCYPLTMFARSSLFWIPHPSQDQQLSKLRLFPLLNVNFSLIINPPTSFTMLSFDLVVHFNC